MPFVVANGTKLHYQTMGSGRPILLIHGLVTGSLASWFYTVAPRLSQKCRVLMYDLRGHGLSERTASGFDTATLMDDLDALIQETGYQPEVMIGHSFGALLALKYALRKPKSLQQLGLIELPLPPSRAGDIESFMNSTPAAQLDAVPEMLKAQFKNGQHRRRMRRFLAQMNYLRAGSTLIADLKNEPDLADQELSSLTISTLAIFGSRSMCLPTLTRLTSQIPTLDSTILQGGHYLHLDAPSALGDRLEAFLHG